MRILLILLAYDRIETVQQKMLSKSKLWFTPVVIVYICESCDYMQVVSGRKVLSVNLQVLDEEIIQNRRLDTWLKSWISMILMSSNNLHLIQMPFKYLLHEFTVVIVDTFQEDIREEIPDGDFAIDLEEDNAVISFGQFGEVI